MYTLLKEEITEEDLLECERDLLKFVIQYEMYFGKDYMTFNVHSLLHVVESVKKSGNLWATSTFIFESNIFQLKSRINGPNRMDQQMSKKALQTLHLKTGNIQYSSPELKDFCTNLFNYKNVSTFYDYGEDEVVFIGKGHFIEYNQRLCKTFKKCIYKGQIFHSVKYQKAKCTIDTMVQRKSGEFGQILEIIKLDKKCYLKISIIITFEAKPFNVLHIDKIKSEDIENCSVIPITDVNCKIVVVNVRNARYLCKLPNDIEAQ